LLAVHPIESKNQKLAENVTVAIKPGVDEVRNIGPTPTITLRHFDRVAVILATGLDPDRPTAPV
jgi:hypothetical protein